MTVPVISLTMRRWVGRECEGVGFNRAAAEFELGTAPHAAEDTNIANTQNKTKTKQKHSYIGYGYGCTPGRHFATAFVRSTYSPSTLSDATVLNPGERPGKCSALTHSH